MEDTGRAISRFDTGSQESNGVSAFIPPATPAVNGQHSPDFTAPAPEPEIVPLPRDEAAREEAKRVSFADIRAGGSGRAGSRGQICRNGGQGGSGSRKILLGLPEKEEEQKERTREE